MTTANHVIPPELTSAPTPAAILCSQATNKEARS
jgi:hypothetical protein